MADRDTIVRAAIELGFDQLTMPAVGKRLGISHSTLYRYFPSRDALAAAAIEHAVNAIEWPEPGGHWRAFLAETAWAHWRLYEAHPGLAKEIIALRLTGPALVRRNNDTGVELLRLGFGPDDAVLIMDMLTELVTQAFLAIPPATVDIPPTDAAQRRRRELVEPWMTMYDSRLRTVLDKAMSGSPTAWFERKLELFLDGTAARLGPA
jgi:AcrR family transcriptional regulator